MSTSLAGSQNPTGTPGTGMGKRGLGQRHKGLLGLGVSSLPPAFNLTGPIVIGKRQDQQISVTGFTNLPGQALIGKEQLKKKRKNKIMFKLLLKSFTLLLFSSSLCKAGRYPDWFWEELNTQLAAAWHAALSTIFLPLILLAAAFWIGSKRIKKR